MSEPRLSVVIITRNEVHRIRRCLDSVRWADELVVVDQCSTDGTAAVCREYGARVISREMTDGFGAQKNLALAAARGSWVLSVDADEVVPAALRQAIEAAITAPGDHVAFRMPRLTAYLGRFIRHCGWYPGRVLRLARRGRARFTDALVHEELVADGPVGDLAADLLHFSYDSFDDHLRKLPLYTGYDAEMVRRRGRRVRGLGAVQWLVLAPALVFLRKFVWQRGFLEGTPGFLLSAMAAFVVFLTHAKVWEHDAGA